ncbi:hypothetical protein PUN28_016623 [Cardiocondyla obscurior]|uniref:Uncharacterized protein n=1 Tax=Cardiocondyla obscurior TaxID=286306 RepID=A0AAW2EP55_9HYME
MQFADAVYLPERAMRRIAYARIKKKSSLPDNSCREGISMIIEASSESERADEKDRKKCVRRGVTPCDVQSRCRRTKKAGK